MKKTKFITCICPVSLTMEETEEIVFLPGKQYQWINSNVPFGPKTIVFNEFKEHHILDDWSIHFKPEEDGGQND